MSSWCKLAVVLLKVKALNIAYIRKFFQTPKALLSPFHCHEDENKHWLWTTVQWVQTLPPTHLYPPKQTTLILFVKIQRHLRPAVIFDSATEDNSSKLSKRKISLKKSIGLCLPFGRYRKKETSMPLQVLPKKRVWNFGNRLLFKRGMPAVSQILWAWPLAYLSSNLLICWVIYGENAHKLRMFAALKACPDEVLSWSVVDAHPFCAS